MGVIIDQSGIINNMKNRLTIFIVSIFIVAISIVLLSPQKVMAANKNVSGSVKFQTEDGTITDPPFDENTYWLDINITGLKYNTNVRTDLSGDYTVSLPCEDTYTLVVNEETTGGLKRIWQALGGTLAYGSNKSYLIGETTVNLNGSNCTNKTGVDIIIKEIEITALEAALIKSISQTLNMINYGVSEASKWIHNALIAGNDVEESYGVTEVWKKTRNVSISLLTLVLVIVAFANIFSISPEKYGATRILPKVILAIILAYFSYLIASFLLDMMSAFQALLFEQAGGQYFQVSMETNGILASGAQVISRIPELIFLIILGIGLLLATLWLLLVLVVRSAMIFILVAVAPIAFIANALPFTEKYYNQWWSSFWKWGFMGPGIAFMLWLTTSFLAAYSRSDISERWFFLIAASVMMWLAATLPLKLGGEIYKQVQKAGGKAAGATGLKARYDEFSKGRKEYANLKAKKDATAIRTKISRAGYLGGVAAGTRGVFGQDFDVAKQMYAAQHKEKDQKESEDRLQKLGGAKADMNNPEVIALLEKIAGEFHTSSLSAETQKALATGVAAGSHLDENKIPDNPKYLNIARNLERNPNKDAAIGLYAKAIDPENGFINDIEYADSLRDSAVRKAAGKKTTEIGRDDIVVLRHEREQNHEMATDAMNKHDEYISNPANINDYNQNTTAKIKSEHQAANFGPNINQGRIEPATDADFIRTINDPNRRNDNQ